VRLPDPERSRVVLIGTSRYEDEKLPDLPVVGRGIEDLKAALTDSDYGLVPESHCDVLVDEGDIRLIGRRLRHSAGQAEDLLLVYFAGHGLTAGRRHELYLALRDTEWEEPEFNALEYDKLRSAVLASPATTKVIILDCCFSGRVFGDTMADSATELIGQVEVDGSYVLASAHRDQVSLILPGEDHTAFTGRLLRLFREGVPGGPELLTIDNIYQQLKATMRAEGLPQPRNRGTDNASLLAVAWNRAFAVTAAPLPDELQQAIENPLPGIKVAAVQELARLLHGKHAGIALAAQLALEQLTGDDSRMVAAAATAALGAPTSAAASRLPRPEPVLSTTVTDPGRLPQQGRSMEEDLNLATTADAVPPVTKVEPGSAPQSDRAHARVTPLDAERIGQSTTHEDQEARRLAEAKLQQPRLGPSDGAANTIELEVGAGSRADNYVVRVISAPSGGGPGPQGSLQLDVKEILARREQLEMTILSSAASGRSAPGRRAAADEGPVREVGQQLFQALFAGPLYRIYRASLEIAQQHGNRMRVVLRLATLELDALPWETLFDPETKTYLCRHQPLVRHIPAPYTTDPLEVRPPLRILGMVASPKDLPPLDVDAEKSCMVGALAGPMADGLVEVVWVPATWPEVHARLLAEEWHVVHFIGHGDYDAEVGQGILALVGSDGQADLAEASRIADLLNEARPTPRLVVLSTNSSSATAATLARSGISAVAAMQFPISDSAASAFVRGFYTAIAQGRSIDEAARSGRISILASRHSLEWITPTLYLRGEARQLFAFR